MLSKENLKQSVKTDLTNAIDLVFDASHKLAQTKSGDITPDQQSELNRLTEELTNLIVEQTFQNV